MNFNSTLLESPSINFVGEQFNFRNCFIVKPEQVQMVSLSETAVIEGIDIVFDKNSPTPPMIHGTINLETGETEESILFFGAKSITIQFHEDFLN